MKAFNFILILLLLASCTPQKISSGTKDKMLLPDISKATPSSILKEAINISENITLLNADYAYDNFDFIKAYGINKERIIKIVTAINPKYFKGINEMEVIHSKKQDARRQADGWYYLDSSKITIYTYDESDGYIAGIILHELKHHYCWVNQQDLSHNKCFLDTPLDKEYGGLIR